MIGVLASLALPRLFSLIERSRTAEAFSMMSSIRPAIERYYLMHDGSYDGLSLNKDDDWGILMMDNPSKAPSSHFDYDVVTGTGYCIFATRNIHECKNCQEERNIIIMAVSDANVRICGCGEYEGIYHKCARRSTVCVGTFGVSGTDVGAVLPPL
jgi:Tfp pilus assembly protein PilE